MTGSGEHERFAHDDAAYLLGGLSEADRTAYEQHLLDCPTCRSAVAELAGLPRLLAQVELPEPPPADLLPRLLHATGRQRRRQRTRFVLVGFAAACLVVLLIGAGIAGVRARHQPSPQSLQPVAATAGRLQAAVTITGGGTAPRIELVCGYQPGGPSYPGAQTYGMVVLNRAGDARELGTWQARSGSDIRFSAPSPWPRSALAEVEVVDAAGVAVLRLRL